MNGWYNCYIRQERAQRRREGIRKEDLGFYKKEEKEMAESYVVEGAKLSCTMGSTESSLSVIPPHRVQLRGSNRANVGDCIPMVCVPTFGVCKTTGMPCVPGCTMWMNGKNDVLIGGLPALLSTSIAVCPLGAGMIRITDDGQ